MKSKRRCCWLLVAASLFPHSPSPASAAGPSQEAPWKRHAIDDSARGADGVRLADINRDGLQDIATGFEEAGLTRIYLHPGPAKAARKWPAITVGKTPSVEDAVFVDLDNDAFVDVVSCCEGKSKTVFVSFSPNNTSDLLNGDRWTQKPLPASAGRMQWMFAMPMHVNDDDRIDVVAAGKGDGAQVGFFMAPKNPRLLTGFTWHAISPVGWVMSIVGSDMDDDGDIDIVITDRYGPDRGCRWLENPGPHRAATEKWNNHFVGAQGRNVMFMTMADLDTDGLTDILVSTKDAEVLLFRRVDKTGLNWACVSVAYPDDMGSAKGVAAGDIDSDGRVDVVVSCEGAASGKSGVKWLSYFDRPFTSEWRGREISGPDGIKFDRIELIDIDRDGDLDVLTCEERHNGKGLGVIWYENPCSGADRLTVRP